MNDLIRVELFDQRNGKLDQFQIPKGSRILDLLEIANLEVDDPVLKICVLAKLRTLDFRLSDEDRVEILRPLIADPKELRLKRARNRQA